MSREIDAMVAEKVMGWTSIRPVEEAERDFDERALGIPPTSSGLLHRVPHYSTDPAAAMEVVERMKVLGFSLDADNFTGTKENPWSVRFGQVAGCWDYDGSEEADTFCKAVCLSALAALRAVGGVGENKETTC